MRKLSLMMLVLLSVVTLLFWATGAWAYSNYYTDPARGNCQSCHGTTNTCAGCHAHGVHSSNAKNDINLTGATNKTTYSPGEQVSVTINGGYRSGWVRAVLYDQNGVEVARSSGTSFPVVLSAPAPSTGGTYTWSAAWYGNRYDAGSAIFGPRWTPDARNPNHGQEIVSTNSFTVVSTAAPDVNLNPASVDFGTVTIGSSVTVSSQIQNLGTADLNVTGITRCTGTSAEFTWSPALPLTVSAGGSQTLSLAYSPVEVGSDNGCLEITSNDPVTPTVTLSLSGTGVTQPTPAAVDLDISRFSASKRVSLKRGTLVALKLVVTNAGTADGTASATLVGTQNGIEVYNQTDTLSIPAGSSLTYRFPTYQPTAAGEITWTVTIADEDPDADIASAVTRVVP